MRGDAFGHFIVSVRLSRRSDQSVAIADPLLDNPAHGTKYYRASVYRLLGAIFLGVGTDDGNLLVLRPKGWNAALAARQGARQAQEAEQESPRKKPHTKRRKKGAKR